MKQELVDPKILRPNPFNPNRVDPKNLEKLGNSLDDLGFFRPAIVRELPGGILQILGGQHRVELAVERGIKKIPIVNLGIIDDNKAKRISLADNARYGSDDSIKLAKLFEEIQIDTPDLTLFLPIQDEDLQVIMRAVNIDLENLEVLPEEQEETHNPEERQERPVKTHDIIKLRCTVRDSEAIRSLIEKTIKKEGLDDGSDDMTLAGSALALLLLKKDADAAS